MDEKKKDEIRTELQDETFSFEIVKFGAVLGERRKTGFAKELNFVKFGDRDPKWDIREWDEGHTKMTKGIRFTEEEIKDLAQALVEEGI